MHLKFLELLILSILIEIDVKTAIKVKIKAKSTTLKSKISAQNHHNVRLFGHKNGDFQKMLRIAQNNKKCKNYSFQISLS